MTISEIKTFPTDYVSVSRGQCHESLLRSYQVLEKVKEMLERGDSRETILELIEECYPPKINCK
jgi:hypothetical protein